MNDIIDTYRLKITDSRLSIQPKRDYLVKDIVIAVVATGIFICTPLLNLYHQTTWGVLSVGFVLGCFALYDLVFNANVTYIFDSSNRNIYQKIPGLYTRKLMPFEEMHLLPVIEDGLLHYAISSKKNKYGKSYLISHPFSESEKGWKKRALYESEILFCIEKHINQ